MLISNIERDNVDITAEAELNRNGKEAASGGQTHHTWVGVVCEYHICEGTGPGIYTMTNGGIDTRRQLLGGVVGMLAGMNGSSCSKSAS